jgi:hypothetical protein
MARGAVPALVLLALLAGCGDRQDSAHRNNTAVLGGSGPGPSRPEPAVALTDARGRPIPPPPAPAQATVQAMRSADDAALAVWVQDSHVVASTWTRASGWNAAQSLERIYGDSTDPRLASNGKGTAMAVWHHRVGNIHSLRYSRFEVAGGWSVPDVLPGALPRPNVSGRADTPDAPRLEMDAQGNVLAQWPSGFHANEMQVARYAAGQGWSRATSEPVASAPSASPANPAPSPGR